MKKRLTIRLIPKACDTRIINIMMILKTKRQKRIIILINKKDNRQQPHDHTKSEHNEKEYQDHTYGERISQEEKDHNKKAEDKGTEDEK